MEETVLKGFFRPEQLRKGREGLGLSISDVGELVGVDDVAVRGWESGALVPSLDQLEHLASAFGLSTDYFLDATPPMPINAYVRSSGSAQVPGRSLESRKVVYRFYELCRYQNQLEALLSDEAQVQLPHPQSSDPEFIAQALRSDLDLGGGPIPDLERVLFRHRIKVFYLEVPDSEFSGLSIAARPLGPAILVALGEPYYRQRFTLGHEFAHLVTSVDGHADSVCDLDWDDEREAFANKVAAAFLMPQHDTELWEFPVKFPSPHPEDLDGLIRRYHVSREAVARRLVELGMAGWGLIVEVRKVSLSEPRPRDHTRRRPLWRRRLRRRYIELAARAHRKGHISIGKLAEYLDVDSETALDFIDAQLRS